VIAATDTHATIEDLLEAAFSVRSGPRLHITRTSCQSSENLQADLHLKVAVVRSEKLIVETEDSSGIQKKWNVRRWKPTDSAPTL
jgi:hypothetical protein